MIKVSARLPTYTSSALELLGVAVITVITALLQHYRHMLSESLCSWDLISISSYFAIICDTRYLDERNKKTAWLAKAKTVAIAIPDAPIE